MISIFLTIIEDTLRLLILKLRKNWVNKEKREDGEKQ
jgi:hypothetical protein